MLRAISRSRIEKIKKTYNPEHDIPEGVQVTWVDAYLLDIIEDLLAEVGALKKQVDDQADVLRRASALAAGESLE